MRISVIIYPLESMGGLFERFFPLKNPQISHSSQDLLLKSAYDLNGMYVGIFIQIVFKVNVANNERKL